LNEAKKLGGIDVVCSYECVSVGDVGAGTLTVECSIEEVAPREMTLAADLDCFNQGLFNSTPKVAGFGSLFK
jgi:hypothetical protein